MVPPRLSTDKKVPDFIVWSFLFVFTSVILIPVW
jgi:hypothetical protein